ncbi:MAG: putative RNA-binding protein with PIN domain [Alteromonas naphthalenivorans]|jgi:predicted RNA-binding protein with PIN domain
MIIIIDGYNLLKLIHGPDSNDTRRSAFINLMGRYIKKRNHKVIIVFDAGPCTYPLKEKSHGIQVIYSGEYQTADDIIVTFVQDNPNKEIVVITKDREIIGHVTKLNKEVVAPLEFYGKVQQAFESSERVKMEQIGSLKKLTDENVPDLDDLMREAARMKTPDKDVEEYTVPRHHEPKGQGVSKKERAKFRVIDKL